MLGTSRLVADDLAYIHAQGPRDGTQGFQTRIGVGIVFKGPNRVCGDAYAPGEMLLAHSRLYPEPSDCSALACALLRGFGQVAFLDDPVCKQIQTVAASTNDGCPT
jgi:hypothetical protein